MSTISLVALYVATLLAFLVGVSHLLNRWFKPHCINELRRYRWLAERLLVYHDPPSNEYALMDEFSATCDELIMHQEGYSLVALCCRGWYGRCRELERRANQLFGAYQALAGDPRLTIEANGDEED